MVGEIYIHRPLVKFHQNSTGNRFQTVFHPSDSLGCSMWKSHVEETIREIESTGVPEEMQ